MYAYFGHHKCASFWITTILRRVCRDAGLRIAHTGRPKVSPRENAGNGLDPNGEFLVLLNSCWGDANRLSSRPGFRGFHVIRDPRDVVISGYFSHLNSHPTDPWPELVEQRNRLARVSEEEGLLATAEFLRPLFEDMADWQYGHESILEVRFEELTGAPFDQFLAIFQFLGLLTEDHENAPRRLVERLASLVNAAVARSHLPLPRWHLRTISAKRVLVHVHDNRFSRLAKGRIVGQTDEASHFRRGVAGDWRNHFTERVKDSFKKEWQGMLEKLGYEKDAAW